MQDKKKTIISGLIVGGLVIAMAANVFNLQNLNKSQVFKSQAAPVSAIELISPQSNSLLEGTLALHAKVRIEKDLVNLSAVVKLGEYKAEPLEISYENSENIILRGTIDSTKYENGNHLLKIFVYSNSDKSPTNVASGAYPIVVKN
ncbi:MAG: hypothetical protein ACD_30C00024G0002 [uncultured bacterium]|uniref:Uncharacterized protein n=3 Tax=Candidatus Daviesiibacteriota TaxID=1752718 RepID=A0A0G0HCK1_9BACT|nr:MAG: hypothetical protein ACD_30C00024G0002 [uncultured bacterium]KKQ09834.1 MAG: hypothetical protein US19_C0010G0012 [Candidatus Daviesbacteria bacterium GW2011_GWB1_36_5]KKQ16019.1 MAG: hypothetical protein US28_C0006G0014 [Candidatus Daviesbacteria bacterium GW2011_GWA1_36_8]OGE31474.1 MAG: hypothetical protein A3C99_02410 [Candidatus Daviesbacteria bacterium RIFCSPHIGHO2_02_FULL_37_9]OGE36354.1 MAG: hypothetical protein A3E66_05665 [Candidatus Daviesbacteria bacterium RIFCSPHIGHO2_12_FU